MENSTEVIQPCHDIMVGVLNDPNRIDIIVEGHKVDEQLLELSLASNASSHVLPTTLNDVTLASNSVSTMNEMMFPIMPSTAEVTPLPLAYCCLPEAQKLVSTIIPAVVSAAVIQSLDDQPLADIIHKNPISIKAGFGMNIEEIDSSIRCLDILIDKLSNLDPSKFYIGRSPGFTTRTATVPGSTTTDQTHHKEGDVTQFFWYESDVCSNYETLPILSSSLSTSVPQLSPANAVKYYNHIRKTWIHRKLCVQKMIQTGSDYMVSDGDFCTCYSSWFHNVTGTTLFQLANQTVEQLMIREASDCLDELLSGEALECWNQMYTPTTCPTPDMTDFMYLDNVPVRILPGRDDYISSLVKLALSARESVDVSTCYLFNADPAQRYIFLDVLPYIARHRNVKVRIMIDQMVIESQVLKSAFKIFHPPEAQKHRFTRGGVTDISFVNKLPSDAPPFSEKSKKAWSALALVEEILFIASEMPEEDRMQVGFWCARDSQEQYRVKNHAKCIVFDKEIAIVGGSNVCPTVDTGNYDLDLVVYGDIAAQVGSTMDYLYEAMKPIDSLDFFQSFQSYFEDEKKDGLLCQENYNLDDRNEEFYLSQDWCDTECKVAFIRSEPSSKGEDIVLRYVLGAIASATESVDMCMGHSNKPMPLARAFADACKRGVKVRLIVNSMYSSDLRVNQQDLFNSLRDLLEVAPDVEVWATCLPSHKKSPGLINPHEISPPFIHSKYTVVDRKWSAVGSWNVWARSAFYEIEHELLIKSEKIATKLIDRFEREKEAYAIRLWNKEDCLPGAGFCPKGCNLCSPFGPFYK